MRQPARLAPLPPRSLGPVPIVGQNLAPRLVLARRIQQALARDAEAGKDPPKPRWRWSCEQLHDYVLFMANTGLRPDEAARLEFRDVTIVNDEATNDERILEIEVRGKRGVGYCKSMPGAVIPVRAVACSLAVDRARRRAGG